MPHLIYGGRLWRFASDELSLPASCAASSRCIWTVILFIIIALTAQSVEECSGQGYYIMGYLIASVGVQVINIICEVCIIRHSMRGTMVDSKPRSEMNSYLTLHLGLALMQLACAVYGVLVINVDFIPCNSVISENGMTILLYIVTISQLADISGILCCATMFSSRTVDVDLHMDEDDMNPHSAHSRRSSSISDHVNHPDLGMVGPSADDLLLWEKRCGSLCRRLQLLTCNVFGGAGVGEDLATVGRVFSNFFHHEGFLDVVPSDVVAGALLVRYQQKIKKIRSREARIKMISEQGIAFDRQPSKYGERSTVILKVPTYSMTPALEDARNIVTAAKEGVVLRPESVGKGTVEMTRTTSRSSNGDTVGVTSRLDKDKYRQKRPPALKTEASSSPYDGCQSIRSAPPSRYSPHHKTMSWNNSEEPDMMRSTPKRSRSLARLPTLDSLPPVTTSFKTRKSYFSALDVLEKSDSNAYPPSKSPSLQINKSNGENNADNSAELEQYEDYDFHVTISFAELSDVTRFSYFALAAYSTLMFLYMYPCSGCCRLSTYGCCHESCLTACCGLDSSSPHSCSCKCNSTGPSSSKSPAKCEHIEKIVNDDNMCRTHESAMRQMVKAPNTELIYAHFSNDIETRPYAVFTDYEKEALVITVRGTLSLEDCVTDAMSEPEPLDEIGRKYGFNGEGRYAHSGFLKSAQWICEDLRKHPHISRLLDAVAGSHPVGMRIDRCNSTDSMSSSSGGLHVPLKPRMFSRLAIVGHSLGAGVASLLALLLRNEFPTLHCYGYGAPGSTMDEETAHEAKSYTTSIVLGDDMVGSLSFHSLSVLREQVLDAIVRSRCSKMSILQSTMFKECSESVLEELLYEPGKEPPSPFRSMFLQYRSHMKRQCSSFVPCQLHIPGKVIHLRQIGKEKDQSSAIGSVARVFVPVVEPDINYFTEIKVSGTMVTDHLPDIYVRELNAMLYDWAKERQAQRDFFEENHDERKSSTFAEIGDDQV